MIQAYSEIAGLTWPQFTAISRLVKQRCGINLQQMTYIHIDTYQE
jgi:hypothetical protein